MNRSRSLSSSDFPPENEIHRNCLQLLFSRVFNTSSDTSSRVIDCLQAGNWDAIDFSQLNQKTNFARTIESDGTETARLLARTIFQYLIYHKINLHDLYPFICKIIKHEISKSAKAFRVANLAAPLISCALTHVQAYSSAVADNFAKHIFAYYLHLRKEKAFKYFYTLLTFNMKENSPGRDFFLNKLDFFEQQAQELLQSCVPQDQDASPTRTCTDELDPTARTELQINQASQPTSDSPVLKSQATSEEQKLDDSDPISKSLHDAWAKLQVQEPPTTAWVEFQADQTHQLTPYFPSLEPPVTSDEQKLDDLDPISKSLHDAWTELQNQKQRVLELLRSGNVNLESTSESYTASLQVLETLFEQSTNEHDESYKLSTLEILKSFKQKQPEQFKTLRSSPLLKNLISLFHQQPLFLDEISEREPRKDTLIILFTTEYSLDFEPVFTHLEQRSFSKINFKRLNKHQPHLDKQTSDLLVSTIFQYLFHQPISFESFNDFIKILINCEPRRSTPSYQPCLTDQLLFTCLAYIFRAYPADQSTAFIAHTLANIFYTHHKTDVSYITMQTFHPVYEALVSVASMLGTSENDPTLSLEDEASFLNQVNQLLSPISISEFTDAAPTLGNWNNIQNKQARELPPLNFDLQTTLQLDSSTPPLEQKKERDVEVTVSISIQQAWNSLQKQKADMLNELKKLTEPQPSNSPLMRLRRSIEARSSSNSSQLANQHTALLALQTLLTDSAVPYSENYHLTAREVLKKFEQEQPELFPHTKIPVKKLIGVIQQTEVTQDKLKRQKKHRRAKTFSFPLFRKPPEDNSSSSPQSIELLSPETPTRTRPRSTTQFGRPPSSC